MLIIFGSVRLQKSKDTHSDVGKSCPHHEVVDPGLQIQDVGWRKDDPSGGQDEKEDGREEWQESFIQTAVLQSVAPVSPENPQRAKKHDTTALKRSLCFKVFFN